MESRISAPAVTQYETPTATTGVVVRIHQRPVVAIVTAHNLEQSELYFGLDYPMQLVSLTKTSVFYTKAQNKV
jgi:hypothetical protein